MLGTGRPYSRALSTIHFQDSHPSFTYNECMFHLKTEKASFFLGHWNAEDMNKDEEMGIFILIGAKQFRNDNETGNVFNKNYAVNNKLAIVILTLNFLLGYLILSVE